MSDISAVWTGASEAGDTLVKLGERMITALKTRALHEVGAMVQTVGGSVAPKRSGRMAGEWTIIVGTRAGAPVLQVGPSAPYARRNDLGFRKPGAHPGRGRGAQRGRVWFPKAVSAVTPRITPTVAAIVNPSRLGGGSYG